MVIKPDPDGKNYRLLNTGYDSRYLTKPYFQSGMRAGKGRDVLA